MDHWTLGSILLLPTSVRFTAVLSSVRSTLVSYSQWIPPCACARAKQDQLLSDVTSNTNYSSTETSTYACTHMHTEPTVSLYDLQVLLNAKIVIFSMGLKPMMMVGVATCMHVLDCVVYPAVGFRQ